ncbi:MAG TPA: trypsin-like peptidase domain-containing protein, partial [Microbacterium sp.]|nr:trypsin-like peptidase domain-containing protein [Microbacterium sp.]
MNDEDALDAYSSAVVRIAERTDTAATEGSSVSARGAGAGSASVISADRHLLTSAHVVAGAVRAEVAFSDGSELEARVVGSDPL